MNLLWVDWLLLKIALLRKAVRKTRERPMLRQLFRSRPKEGFQARSPERDTETDNDAVRSVAGVIDQVLEKAEAERDGLKNRLENVLAVAAIVGGNDVDDYLTRTQDRSEMLHESDAEIRRGQQRLKVIEQNITHFKFLRAALQSRFPDCKI
jgi:hypothetical protein